jgi:hypothetical protein
MVAAACGSEDDADAGGISDPEPGMTTASLMGEVTRSIEPVHGGIGTLYLAVFELDPVENMDAGLMPLAQATVAEVDLHAEGSSVTYEITDIAPRAEPYFVTAFLDDNGTVNVADPETSGPDMGDLVSLDGFASPAVVLDKAGTLAFDIDLNFAMPF